jgi:hypothetical protein
LKLVPPPSTAATIAESFDKVVAVDIFLFSAAPFVDVRGREENPVSRRIVINRRDAAVQVSWSQSMDFKPKLM